MWPFAPYPQSSAIDIDGKEFDYVVIGGGTAGCVLASRLSERPDISVLVIERGHAQDDIMSRIPMASQNLYLGEKLQVQNNHWTEPISGANGRKARLWSAHGLGGASRVNAMLWTRCPGDYAEWSRLGFHDWDWSKVEPYFRRVENAMSHPSTESRGHAGPIQLQQRRPPFEWVHYLEKAAQKVGLPVEKDCNDVNAPVSGYFLHDTIVNNRGERASTFKAFLNHEIATSRRSRLTICTGTVAVRLEISNNEVAGVRIRSTEAPEEYSVKARKEVIVCCGAIPTTQLLLLSGIGPKESADRLGIPLVKELPVGLTLSDHYSFPILLDVLKRESLSLLESIWGLWYMLLWCFNGSGLMGMTAGGHSIFVRSQSIDAETMSVKPEEASVLNSSRPHGVPDIEVMVVATNTLEKEQPGPSFLCLYPTVVQPHGQGKVELVDTNPLSHPKVTYSMLEDERDVVCARRSIRFAMRLAEKLQQSGYPHPAPFAFAPGNNTKFRQEWVRDVPEFDSEQLQKTWKDVTDDEIDRYMRRFGNSSIHYSCTCPMSHDDKTGVVDQKLRVHGIAKLRVADTSVFPKIPSGHTMAPAIMVADRCADFVKEAS